MARLAKRGTESLSFLIDGIFLCQNILEGMIKQKYTQKLFLPSHSKIDPLFNHIIQKCRRHTFFEIPTILSILKFQIEDRSFHRSNQQTMNEYLAKRMQASLYKIDSLFKPFDLYDKSVRQPWQPRRSRYLQRREWRQRRLRWAWQPRQPKQLPRFR